MANDMISDLCRATFEMHKMIGGKELAQITEATGDTKISATIVRVKHLAEDIYYHTKEAQNLDATSMLSALKAIAAMHVDADTDHVQLSALCIATARTELRHQCCGDAACFNESSGLLCAAHNVQAR